MGLKVLDLDGDGVARAARYHPTVPALSLSDAFALALAHRTGSTLLTGDARLQRLARDEKIVCRSALWHLDRMHDEQTATLQRLYDGLVSIRDHPRSGLPRAEVNKPLQTFERGGQCP